LLIPPSTITHACRAAEDLIIKQDEKHGQRVAGAVTNWTLVSLNHDTQSCMDPNVVESKIMVRACRVYFPFFPILLLCVGRGQCIWWA